MTAKGLERSTFGWQEFVSVLPDFPNGRAKSLSKVYIQWSDERLTNARSPAFLRLHCELPSAKLCYRQREIGAGLCFVSPEASRDEAERTTNGER